MTEEATKIAANAVPDDGMQNFYVTYCHGTMQKNCFSIVRAVDHVAARCAVLTQLGCAWGFMYNEAEFVGENQQERYQLTQIPLQAQVWNTRV